MANTGAAGLQPMPNRRLMLIALLWLAVPAALAQTVPSRPLRLVVGFPPGGSTDQVARLLAPQLAEHLGRPVIVENRPGASGNLAADAVARSGPGGQMLLLAATSFAMSPALNPHLTWDPLKDFTPVAMVATVPIVIAVGPSVSARSLQEFLTQSRAKPGIFNLATPGAATFNRLLAEQFMVDEGLRWTTVNYSGGARALQDVLAGHADILFANVSEVSAHIRSGSLKGLAVTGAHRSQQLPQVPTLAELGQTRVSGSAWQALFGPAGMSTDDVEQLRAAVTKTLSSYDLATQLQTLGIEIAVGTPQELEQMVAHDVQRARNIVQIIGMPTE